MRFTFHFNVVFTFLLFTIVTVKSQVVAPPVMTPIGIEDTLQWLQTHIGNNSSHFSGKPLSVIWDSLYALRWKIAEFDPPMNLSLASMIVGTSRDFDKDTLYVDSLTFYFAPITDGGTIFQLHESHDWNNILNHTNFSINTHVKFFKVYFQNSVRYLRSIASSENGFWEWKWGGFQEYYWGGNIVQSVTVGEY